MIKNLPILLFSVIFSMPVIGVCSPSDLIFGHDLYYFVNAQLRFENKTCVEVDTGVATLLRNARAVEQNLAAFIVWECNKTSDGKVTLVDLKYQLKPKNSAGRHMIKDFINQFEKTPFLGVNLQFQRVVGVVASSKVSTYSLAASNAKLIDTAVRWNSYNYDDETLPDIKALDSVVESKSARDFLKIIKAIYGNTIEERFEADLGLFNYVNIEFEITVLLENGESVDSQSGWFNEKDCRPNLCDRTLGRQ